jgi:hypothetical protein
VVLSTPDTREEDMTSDELRRLFDGPLPGEEPGGAGLETATARCAGDAPEVLARAREVMAAVLTNSAGTWPSELEWRELLPSWFVEACADEETPEQTRQRLARWEHMTLAERALETENEAWSVDNWIAWLEPEERQWFWWSADVSDPDQLVVQVEVAGWPAATGALAWLLRASGAVEVTIED